MGRSQQVTLVDGCLQGLFPLDGTLFHERDVAPGGVCAEMKVFLIEGQGALPAAGGQPGSQRVVPMFKRLLVLILAFNDVIQLIQGRLKRGTGMTCREKEAEGE